VEAYTIPTDFPESDGTFVWDSTTLVLVEATAGGGTAPSIHAHPCCALGPAVHVEYFHDHARIERMLFDGALEPQNGKLFPDRSRPGLGLEFKRADAERWRVEP